MNKFYNLDALSTRVQLRVRNRTQETFLKFTNKSYAIPLVPGHPGPELKKWFPRSGWIPHLLRLREWLHSSRAVPLVAA